MKAATIMKKIISKNECSIAKAEHLTSAAKREGKLEADKAIRFRILFGNFDIVNGDFYENGLSSIYSEPMNAGDLADYLNLEW